MRRSVWLALLVLAAGCNCNEYGFVAAKKTGDLSAPPPPRARFDTRGIATCGPGEVTDEGEDALRRYPYLQHVETARARVLWTATSEQPGSVRVSLAGEEVLQAPAVVDTSAPLPEGTQFVAQLEGLAPGTMYCYEVVGPDGEVWVGATSLLTAPEPDAPDPVRFVAMGDVGKSEPDQFAVLEQLEKVEMEFLLIAGDVAYNEGTLAQFEQHVFGVYRDIFRRVPVFPATGNHDYRTRNAQPYTRVFSLPENAGTDAGRERWYSFDWGDIHVVILDTEKFGDEQIAWADADLGASDATWKIAVTHKPPFSSGKNGDDRRVQRAFKPLFERHGVDLVLSGHDHHYERSRPVDGVHYIVTGGGGRGTRRVGRNGTAAFVERVAHFVYFVVDGDRLTMYAIDAEGTLFDTLQLRASGDASRAER